MWILKKIEAKNIMAFQDLAYTLRQGVSTLVFGNNMDNDSQGSNGSGKSALIEAVSLAITGDTLRKIKTEEIINDNSDNAEVHATFYNTFNHETFEVSRFIFRKGTQKIECAIKDSDNNVIKEGETVQSSVSEYNKYILEKIGITKDELYNNFLLSEYTYSNFLSSSDKEKKEIINKFSNALLVDEAINALNVDITNATYELQKADLALSNVEGRLAMLEEQKDSYERDYAEKQKEAKDKIIETKESIAENCRAIKTAENDIADLESSIERFAEVKDSVLKIRNKGISDSKQNCLELDKLISTRAVPDDVFNKEIWLNKIETLKSSILSIQSKIKENEQLSAVLLQDLSEATSKETSALKDYEKAVENKEKRFSLLSEELMTAHLNVHDCRETINDLEYERDHLGEYIANLNNKLAGEIECPQCSHHFVLDHSIDVTKAKAEVATLKVNKTNVEKDILKYQEELQLRKQEIENIENKLKLDNNKVDETLLDCRAKSKAKIEIEENLKDNERRIKRLNDELIELQNKDSKISDDCFNSTLTQISAYNLAFTNSIESKRANIHTLRDMVGTLQGIVTKWETALEGDEEIASKNLVKQIASEKKDLKKAVDKKEEISNLVNSLKHQYQKFTDFKTYLANTKIEALAKMTNGFLRDIESDIQVQLDGYVKLKNGQTRDRISISLLRNGVDAGSFNKFSKGEKARVNIANILAMRELVNINCEMGKGLDLLILDEILEGTDESGLANILDALNKLQTTSLVVSHGNVAENYPYKLIVNKQNGVSFIDEI